MSWFNRGPKKPTSDNYMVYASMGEDGHVLVSLGGNDRLLMKGHEVDSFIANYVGANQVADFQNGKVIEVAVSAFIAMQWELI